MRWFHGLRGLVVGGACIGVIATACGGDGGASSDGGTSGTQAMAGQADGTGNTGNGAAGDTQGSGGTENKAGSSNGGSAMSNAGAPGAAGDSSAAGSGAGGASDQSVAMCQEACKKDGDCLPGDKCIKARCEPATPPAKCTSDDACEAQLAGWTSECDAQTPCLPTQACVDIGEKMGRCATKAGGAVSCATLQDDEVTTKDFDGKDVTVCGKARVECGADGTCRQRCDKNSCPTNFSCNATTGSCECANDTACLGQPNVSKCEAGRCVCASDGDCKTNANKCVAGTCGCGDASVCTGKTTNPGTSWVCE